MTQARRINKRTVAGRCTRGLMLMEVVVSMVVLSIGIVAVSRSFSVALHARGLAQDYTDARFLASNTLATLIADTRIGNSGGGEGGFGPDWPRFSWQAKVSQSQFEYNRIVPTGGMKSVEDSLKIQPLFFGKVDVTIKWTRRGQEHSRTVSALVPPLGEIERRGLLVE